MSSSSSSTAATRSFGRRIFDWLSGYGLATSLLLILGVLTWLATLEQREFGLYATLNKYFHWKSPVLFPVIEGKTIPLPLPGGYWVCALLTLNLLLGGIIRARKGWMHLPNLISHCGIIVLLIGGGVTHLFSERGNVAVGEGQTSDVAEDYLEYVVEVAEIIENKPSNIHVIRGPFLEDLETNVRRFDFKEFPFSLQIKGYVENGLPISEVEQSPRNGEYVSDGYYIQKRPLEKQAESNTAACYAKILLKDGSSEGPIILAGASFQPYTLRVGERVFTLDMHKRLWPMPFNLTLNKFTAEFYPGTARPKSFVSEVTRTENGVKADSVIQMNQPLRYEGLTFYQASYGPPGAGPNERLYSVFEVVRNPADKWPEISLWIVVFGLVLQFGFKLVRFILSRFRHASSN